jgi:hypothetical protein
MKKIFVGAILLLTFHSAYASKTACGPMTVADAKAYISDDATLDINDFDSVLPTLIQSSQVGDPEICLFLGVDINMFENLYLDVEQLEDAFKAAGLAQDSTSYNLSLQLMGQMDHLVGFCGKTSSSGYVPTGDRTKLLAAIQQARTSIQALQNYAKN